MGADPNPSHPTEPSYILKSHQTCTIKYNMTELAKVKKEHSHPSHPKITVA